MQQNLSELLDAYEDWGFSGTVLVARGNHILFEKGYGYANRATQEPNAPDTRFDMASIAKTFTGAAILALEADGVLQVDDRLEDYIGAFPDERKSTVTFHHVAAHVSGLAHRRNSQLAYGTDHKAYIESVRTAPFETPPGEAYRYSNGLLSFLAALVQDQSEVTYESFIRSRFFEPLGLKSAGFVSEVSYGEPGLALPYADDSDTSAGNPYNGWAFGMIGSTGITATVGDIYKWYSALRAGEVLPDEQTARLFDLDETEAYGWHTEHDEKGRLRIHKGGGLPAMNSQIIAFPEEDIVIVWALNGATHNWRRTLNASLSAIALDESYSQVPSFKDIRYPSSKKLEPGVYSTADGYMLELVVENGQPVLRGNGIGAPAGLLRPGHSDNFVLFSPDMGRWIDISASAAGSLEVSVGPDGEEYTFELTDRPATTMLHEPSEALVPVARAQCEALLAGDATTVWKGSLYRPIDGLLSEPEWTRRAAFLQRQLGDNLKVVREAWAREAGAWSYWCTIGSGAGAQAILRFLLTSDGQISDFGMNPVQNTPEVDEIREIQ